MKTNLLDWLRSHDLISIHALEKKLDIPQSTLNKALTGNRPLPQKYVRDIERALKGYGYKPV